MFPFSDHMTYSQFVGPQMNRSNRFHQARFPAFRLRLRWMHAWMLSWMKTPSQDCGLDYEVEFAKWPRNVGLPHHQMVSKDESKPFQAVSGSTWINQPPNGHHWTPGGLPDVPLPFQASGQVSMLISYHEGEVRWFKPFLL